MLNILYSEVFNRFKLFTSINKRKPDFNLVNQVLKGRAIEDGEIDGVYYIIIGEPKVIYTAHYDTAGDSETELVSKEHMPHIIMNRNKGILGADDKSGLTVISFMIEHNVPGLYLFFGDEESGASQSRDWAESDFYTRYKLPIGSIVSAIAFDRKGYGDVIQTQRSKQCCSMQYAETLSTILSMGGFHYRPADGVYTDTANMIYKIPECTNLSIGYFSQHTDFETQDMLFLHKMVNFMINNHESISVIPAFKGVETKPVPIPTKWKPYTPYDKSKYEVYDYETGRWITEERKKKAVTIPKIIDYSIEISDHHVLSECLDLVIDALSATESPILVETDIANYIVINKSNYIEFEIELLGTLPEIPNKNLLSKIDIYSFLATLMSAIEANNTVYIYTTTQEEDTGITYSANFGIHIFTNVMDEFGGGYNEEPRADEIDTTGVSESFHV